MVEVVAVEEAAVAVVGGGGGGGAVVEGEVVGPREMYAYDLGTLTSSDRTCFHMLHLT